MHIKARHGVVEGKKAEKSQWELFKNLLPQKKEGDREATSIAYEQKPIRSHKDTMAMAHSTTLGLYESAWSL